MRGDLGTHRSEQQARETSSAAGADDDEFGGLGRLEQHGARRADRDDPANVEPGEFCAHGAGHGVDLLTGRGLELVDEVQARGHADRESATAHGRQQGVQEDEVASAQRG